MADILEIGGNYAPKKARVAGRDVEITGIPAAAIARLVRDVPAIAQAVTSRSASGLDLLDLIKTAPDAVGPFLAAGCNGLGDAEAEKWAARLPVGVQLDLAKMVLEVTFPEGLGPFMQALGAAAEAMPKAKESQG